MDESDRDKYMKSWFAEQPTLSEEMVAADTRRSEELAVIEKRRRDLQELDRVCALSSPRVAFERRLDYLVQTREWSVSFGMISGCTDEDVDTSNEDTSDKDTSDEDTSDEDTSDEDTSDEGFEYIIDRKKGLSVKDINTTRAFLMKDHGNVVHFHLVGFCMKITLYVLPDPESLTVDKLEKELKRSGLSVERTILVARLQQHIATYP
jgi:hypothetical protein